MTNEGILDIWLEAPRVRAMRPWSGWMLGVLAAALLGSAIAGPALERVQQAHAAGDVTQAAREWRHPALDRQWRGTRTPVDIDRMFRKRR